MLTKFDFEKLITEQTLNQITQGNEALVDGAIIDAQAEMESYLNQKYDMAVEFAKTGTARNPLLVIYMVDLALFHLHSRINPKMIPELRGFRYENAIKWMDKVSRGKLTPNLAALQNEDGEDVNAHSRFGGNPKVNHQH